MNDESSQAYRVGDVIAWPAEPPVETELECQDSGGTFRVHRDEKGWYLAGTKGGRRRLPWRTVVELWLPARIVKLGGQ